MIAAAPPTRLPPPRSDWGRPIAPAPGPIRFARYAFGREEDWHWDITRFDPTIQQEYCRGERWIRGWNGEQGLGLRLAQLVALAHGGEVSLPESAQGFAVQLTLVQSR